MKIVVWKDEYREDGSRNVIRKVKEVNSINDFVKETLKDVDFAKDDIVVRKDNIEQIRIPELVYKDIKDEVKSILKRESLPAGKKGWGEDERWVKEHYWQACKAFIFDFNTYRIMIGVEWGYEGIEDEREEISFMPFEHSFIAEFIDCAELRWGEAGEKENIKKWLK